MRKIHPKYIEILDKERIKTVCEALVKMMYNPEIFATQLQHELGYYPALSKEAVMKHLHEQSVRLWGPIKPGEVRNVTRPHEPPRQMTKEEERMLMGGQAPITGGACGMASPGRSSKTKKAARKANRDK